jgi:RimJ/RimL family protein N-acetyltransferase
VSEPYLRKANIDDMDLLFKWANDQITRQNAFSTKLITYEEHQQWFSKKLESNSSFIYIYCLEDVPVGQVRIDIENTCGVISYSIDAAYRSRGHGGTLLRLMEETVKNDITDVKLLQAKVKNENFPSRRIFERMNYHSTENDDYIEYEKSIR